MRIDAENKRTKTAFVPVLFRSGAARWLEIRTTGTSGGYRMPIDGEAEKRAGKDDLKTWKR
jgi:hypothetical protein